MATPIEREKSDGQIQVSFLDTISLLKDRIILLLFLGIFFIVGVDVAANYISSKLMSIRFGWLESEVKFAPQVYFFCRTIGALLGMLALARVSAIKYFRVNIIFCILSLFIMIFVDNDRVNLCFQLLI